MKMRGIIAVPATPFRGDNSIDEASLRRYAKAALKKGVAGILVPAMAGEVTELEDAERLLTAKVVLKEAGGRVPVIGGATAADQSARLRNAEALIALGCDGVLVHIPFQGEAAYARDIQEIADLNPGFLMIQDLDSSDRRLPVPLLAELSRALKAFTWVKVETADRGRKITEIFEATGGKLQIGTAGTEMIAALDRGVHAYLPTLYHDIYGRVFSLYKGGRREEAKALFHRLLPNLVFHASHPKLAIRLNKIMLQREGIFKTTRVRTDNGPLDPFEARTFAELMETALGLSAALA